MIQAGTASEIITPARGIPLAGYFDPRPNTGAHDDLKVKVTLFRQGDLVTGFVSYDLCFICMNIIDAVYAEYAQIRHVKCTVSKLAPPLGGKLERVSVVLEK